MNIDYDELTVGVIICIVSPLVLILCIVIGICYIYSGLFPRGGDIHDGN